MSRNKPRSGAPPGAYAAPTRELQQLLLDPIVRKAIKVARAGVTFRKPVSALKIRWESATLSQLVKWLRAGAPFDMLAALLKSQPSLVWHPLVHFQLIRLRTFPSTEDEAFKAHLASGEDGYDRGGSGATGTTALDRSVGPGHGGNWLGFEAAGLALKATSEAHLIDGPQLNALLLGR